jgi:hypothetical protein
MHCHRHMLLVHMVLMIVPQLPQAILNSSETLCDGSWQVLETHQQICSHIWMQHIANHLWNILLKDWLTYWDIVLPYQVSFLPDCWQIRLSICPLCVLGERWLLENFRCSRSLSLVHHVGRFASVSCERRTGPVSEANNFFMNRAALDWRMGR